MRQSHKTVLLWITMIVAVGVIWQFLNGQRVEEKRILFSTFAQDVDQHPEKFKAGTPITIRKNQESAEIHGQYATGENFVTTGIIGDKLLDRLDKAKLNYEVVKDSENGFWQQVFVTWLPMLVLVVLFLVFMRQLQVGGGKAMSFGKSKAKLLSENQRKMTFADVAGIEEAKDEVEEIIAFLKDPKKFTRLGGRIPKGVLMMGPPGTGKTLLARAIAGEAGVPFFSISGSDFVEMFVGVGASRVRDLFEQGKKNAPCIIFIDEIDAVGRHRGAGLGGGHDEREQTLNQLLVEMDGFESNEGVILIAATNRPDVLDPALLRPGRFDRRIVVPRPDVRGRTGILAVHTKKTPLAGGVDLDVIARGTPGFSPQSPTRAAADRLRYSFPRCESRTPSLSWAGSSPATARARARISASSTSWKRFSTGRESPHVAFRVLTASRPTSSPASGRPSWRMTATACSCADTRTACRRASPTGRSSRSPSPTAATAGWGAAPRT